MLWAVNAAVDSRYEDYFERQFGEAVENREHAELVIFGTSFANFGINPKYLEPLGYRVYNFAAPAATPPYYLEWYDKIFRKYYDKPKVILLQADWFMFSGWRTRKFEDDSEYFPPGVFWECLASGRYDRWRLVIRRYSMLKLRDEWENWERGRAEMSRSFLGFERGYVPLFSTPDSAEDLASIPWQQSEFEAAELSGDFETLLDEFKKDGITVILVQAPHYLPAIEANAVIRDALLDQNRRIAEIARRRGLVFLDYNGSGISEINSDYRLFSRTHHLNDEGARQFSMRLEQDLARILPKP